VDDVDGAVEALVLQDDAVNQGGLKHRIACEWRGGCGGRVGVGVVVGYVAACAGRCFAVQWLQLPQRALPTAERDVWRRQAGSDCADAELEQ